MTDPIRAADAPADWRRFLCASCKVTWAEPATTLISQQSRCPACNDTREATSLWFATVVRQLGVSCREHGMTCPGFRSPPKIPGVDRTLRHRPDGGWVVSVTLRGRPRSRVLSDMIRGTLAANDHAGDETLARVVFDELAPHVL